MIKFNDNHIITGYIKQLLSSYYLPHYNNGKWGEDSNYYVDNNYVRNETTTLRMNSNIYDTHTHEYLGNYLRYLRDVKRLNLMSLYNCFSNNIPNNLNYVITKQVTTPESSTIIYEFSSSDKNSKIYLIPVKFGKTYTLAIDAYDKIETTTIIYNKYLNTALTENLGGNCNIYRNLKFNQPITIEIPETENSKLLAAEDNLKLVLKIPANNTSSIVLLEGNYIGNNDLIPKNEKVTNTNTDTDTPETMVMFYDNYTVISFEKEALDALNEGTNDFDLKSNIQLLRFNTGVSYPFGDRLIEYLAGQTITHLDEIKDNIVRVQTGINCRTTPENKKIINKFLPGVWTNSIRAYMYEAAVNYYRTGRNQDEYNKNHDILGYVDKDIEQIYEFTDESGNKVSLINVDIYPDIYLASKAKEK